MRYNVAVVSYKVQTVKTKNPNYETMDYMGCMHFRISSKHSFIRIQFFLELKAHGRRLK